MTVQMHVRRKGRSVEQRFFDFVIPEPNTGCWLWFGSLTGSGYGVHYIARGHREQAHRFSWEIHNGKIPDGLQACHRCDVRCCVNPEHIFLGTQSDNLQDMVKKGRARPRRGESSARARLSENDIAAIRKDARRLEEIGRDYRIDKSRVWKIKHGHEWKHSFEGVDDAEKNRLANGRKFRARGETHHKAKLVELDVKNIRRDTRSSRKIAADYGVTKTTILAVKKNKIWRHTCG